jgi:hypothetical protein
LSIFVNGVRVDLGGDAKDSVRAATTANITLSGLQTIDGVVLLALERVLVKNQTSAVDNGIYEVATGVWVRASDADTDAKVTAGFSIFVEEGTVNADTGWLLATDNPITVGTTPLTFTKFSPSPAAGLAGAGLEDDGFGLLRIASTAAGNGLGGGSGVPLEVNVDGTTLEIVADDLQVKDAGIDEDKLAASVAGNGLSGGAGSALAVNVDGSTIAIATDILGVPASGITATQIAASVAGSGLSGGAGTPLAVNTDGSTLEITADTLNVKAAGITSTQLAASVAGNGLSGGAGSPLAVNVDGSTIQIASDTLSVVGIPEAATLKLPCKNATTGNITLSGLQSIDANFTVAGDRILVRAQTTSSENGIYLASAGAWTRSSDCDSDSDIAFGVIVQVLAGTAFGKTMWSADYASTLAGGLAFSQLLPSALATDYARVSISNTWAAGSVQTFNRLSSTSNVRFGSNASDPGSPVSGDIWFTGTALKYRDASETRIIEHTGNKNIASGYAGLDGTSRIAKAQGYSATVYSDQSNVYTAGFKQTFTTSSAVSAGLNIGAAITDPAAPVSGDMWLGTFPTVLKVRMGLVTQTAEMLSNKNVATGYAGLDGSTKLSGAQQTYGLLVNTAAEGDKVIRKDGSVAFTADQSMGSFKLTNLASPVAATDAVNKSYADAAITGLDVKQTAKAATTADITLSGAQTIDGVSIVASDVVLVKNQTLGENNGLYSAAAGAWTRTTDTDTATEIESMFVFVAQGTTQANTGWYLTTDSITLGTTPLVYVQFSGPGAFVAGDGIDITGNSISVDVSDIAGAGLENDGSNNLRISTAAAGNGLSGGGGSALAVNVDGTSIEIVTDTLQVKAAGITETHLNTSVAGSGLSGGGGAALSVNVTDGIEISADTLRISTAAAGTGLTGGGGVALSVTNAVREDVLTWNVSGNLATGSAFDGARICLFGGTITGVTMFLEDRGGTGGGGITRVDILKHTPAGAITTARYNTGGTSIYSVTPLNRPNLAGDAASTENGVVEAAAPDTTSFAADDFFTMDIVARPTGPNSAGLTVQLHVQYT